MGLKGWESTGSSLFWVLSHFFRQTHFGALKYWQYSGWSSTKGDAWWMAAWHPPLGSRSLSENMLKLQDAVVCSFLQMFALRHWENCHQSAAFDTSAADSSSSWSPFSKKVEAKNRLFHSPRSSWSPAWCEWRSSSGTLPLFLGEVTRSFPVSPETEH